MSNPIVARRSRLIVRTLFVLVLAGLAIGVVVARSDSEPGQVEGSGTLTVDGVVYSFTPTTCLISDEDFVAAGPGFDGADRFWVSASSVGLDLAVGTESEIDEPAEDQLWLISDGLDWRSTGDDTVTASAAMTDHRSPQSTTVLGSLVLNCRDGDF